MKRAAVRQTQSLLNLLGAGLSVDGLWGPKSQVAMDSLLEEYIRQAQYLAESPVYGAYIWRLSKMADHEIVAACKAMNLSRLLVKIMNKHGRPMYAKRVPDLVKRCRDSGIAVWGWAYLDDKHAESDGVRFVELEQEYGLYGAVANMEREIVDGKNTREKEADAEAIGSVLQQLETASLEFGFSSFRRRDYFPFPQELLEDYTTKGLVCMPQCYNLRGEAAWSRVRECVQSWLAWDLQVRVTLGAFTPKSSRSGTFGSDLYGLRCGMLAVEQLHSVYPRLDNGFDLWALEQIDPDMQKVVADYTSTRAS